MKNYKRWDAIVSNDCQSLRKQEKYAMFRIQILFLSILLLVISCIKGQSNYMAVSGDTSGYTPGSFNVTDGGAASYSIPIIISPGSSGMQPSLSVAYSSQGGNGLMGLGWSLQGLSAITRAQQTIAQDGQNKGITLTSTDRYSLDGERLIITDLGVTYGSNGAEYRTEQNAFSKVVSYGNVGGGIPQYFKVWTNAGLIMEYGNSNDSRIEVNGSSPLFWLLNKVTDTKGNYYTINYTENSLTGEYVPNRIDYTGNQNAGITPYASIRFEYENRPDTIDKYMAGVKVSLSEKRLTAIRSYYGNSIVRSYLFSYQLSPAKLSQMVKVQECGSDGRCHTPTTFEWTNIGSYTYYPFSIGNIPVSSSDDIMSLDMNADGVQDIVKIPKYTGSPQAISIYISNKDQNNLLFQNISISPPIYNDSTLIFCDFNADGRTDIFQYATVSGANRIYTNTTPLSAAQITFNATVSSLPNNIFNDQNIVISADYNADGRSDLLCFNPVNGNNFWAFSKMTGSASPSFVYNNANGQNYFQNLIPQTTFFTDTSIQPLFADYDGDGLTDVLFWNKTNGNNNLYKNNGGSSITFSYINGPNNGSILPPSDIAGSSAEIITVDLNSDGLPEIFWKNIGNAHKSWLNTGGFIFKRLDVQSYGYNGTYVPIGFFTNTNNSDAFIPADFNADGYTDFIAIRKSSGISQWLCNTGSMKFTVLNSYSYSFPMLGLNYSSPASPHLPVLSSSYVQNYNFQGAGNFTSRSMLDFMFVNPSASPQLRVLKGVTTYNNLISKINVGSGQRLEIAYEFLTSDSVYTRQANAVYPLMDYQASQFVVKSYSTDDGVGGMRSMDYRFVGAKLHLNGRGFRGYSEVHMADRTTGIVQSKYYVSDTASYKFLNSPLVKSVTKLPNGVAINITEYENELKSFYQGRCSYSYVKRNRSKNYELDGSFIDSTVTSQDYDDYGNVIRTVTDYSGGYKDSLVNVFYNNPSTWIIGRLMRSDLYRYSPGGQTAHKASAFEYDLTNSGLLTKEITEPDSSANVRIEKNYTYDSFGNILESATTAWNGTSIQSRKGNTQYDPLGRFILSTTNDLGHVITKTYDPLLGMELTVTDPNGLVTVHTYDGFGRKTRTTAPDGNWTHLDYRKCGTGVTCPPLSYHVLIEQSSVNPKAIKYYDLYNREIRSEKIGFNGTPVYQDNQYNDRNLVVRKSDPYFSNESPVWTEFQYDLSGRNIVTVYPGNRVDSTYYQGRVTVFVNPKGQRKTLVKDAKEQLIISRDHFNQEISYQYDARGNLLSMTDPKGNVITMTFDIYGNKTSMNDPDMGLYSYVYNRFGELVKQTDPKGEVVTLEYDILGRETKRTEPEGVTIWTYDTRPYGIGLPATVTGLNGYNMLFDYDNLSRKIKETQTIAGNSYVHQYTYDAQDRPKRVIYPTGFSIENDYNANGYLYQIRNAQNNKIYWKATAITAREQITQQQYGNGLTIDRNFDQNTNYLTSINTKKGSSDLQKLGFSYDAIGNLMQRTDLLQNKQEDFEYDMLNRLVEAKVLGGDSLIMQYDELGNITYKSDVGVYHYGGVNSGPHQLQSIDLNTTQCIPSLLISTDYTSFNKVKEVTKDSTRINVYYNADRQRNLQQMFVNNNLVRTKIYVSSLFEKEIRPGDTLFTHFIKSPEGTVAIYLEKDSGLSSLSYLHRDHLGSVVMVTSDTGAIVARYSYDAWGKRRNSDWSSILTDSTSLASDRGYTGHEHYDLFDLIDMNGRIYDPVLARFLSPDPYIQDPTNLQNLNRYTYVLNNPLSLIDPSGYFFKWLFKAIRSVVKAVVKVFTMVGGILVEAVQLAKKVASVAGKWLKENWRSVVTAAIAITASILTAGAAAGVLGVMLSGAASGFASGVTSTLLNGGNIGQALLAGLKGGAISSISAVMTFGVGSLAESAQNSIGFVGGVGVKAIGHGTIQGLSNVVQGGKFAHGFYSGAISGSISPAIMEQFESKIAQVAVSAVAGGTTSALCGGKFANGAVGGAFIMMFNDQMHPESNSNSDIEMGEPVNGNSYETGIINDGSNPSIGSNSSDLDAKFWRVREQIRRSMNDPKNKYRLKTNSSADGRRG